jgi:hypothetical protein
MVGDYMKRLGKIALQLAGARHDSTIPFGQLLDP